MHAGPPPGVGLKTPQARPLNFPLGRGPGDLQGMLGYHHPAGDLQGMLGYHQPLCTEFLTHTTENITLPQTSFAGSN